MRWSLTLTAILVAAVSAGCIGAPGKTMTAREGLDDARAVAEGWAEGRDLGLLGIVAVEPFKHIQSTDEDGEVDAEFVTHLDGNPGDGNAPGWIYGFFNGERCIVVVLAAGLGVLAEGYETCAEFDTEVDVGDGEADGDGEGDEEDSGGSGGSGPDVVGDWSVDSNEVAEILAGEEEWPDLGDDGTYFWGLFGDDGETVWVVGGIGEDGESVEAVVDAQSGEVIAVEHVPADDLEGFFGGETTPSEPGGSAGAPGRPGMDGYSMVNDEVHEQAVTAVTPATASVELEGSGGYLVADASVLANLNGVGMVRVVLSGPDGEIQSEGIPNFTGGTAHFEVAGLPAGTYTLSVEAGPGSVAAQVDAYLEGGWR